MLVYLGEPLGPCIIYKKSNVILARSVDGVSLSVAQGAVVAETEPLGPFESGFPSKCQHAARVGGKNRERWGWFAEELLSQCYSVWTPMQPMFYGLWLLSATRAFRVDCHVKLIGVSLEEGVVTNS